MRGAAYLIKWGDDQWVVEAPTIQLAIDAWIRAQEQGQVSRRSPIHAPESAISA